MKKIIALILTLTITVISMASCQISIAGFIHSLSDETPGYFTYTDFTDEEKELFEEYIGYVIPFAPTDSYSITSLYDDGDYEEGIRFYTLYNTREDFDAYLARFTDFNLVKSEADKDGDIWYYLQTDNIVVCTSYYQTISFDIIDVFVYIDEDPITEGGVLTNDGVGLPEGIGGVCKLDFTTAEHALNVSDHYVYADGCPTVGTPSVLVIPVQFSDVTAASRGYSIDTIKKVFTGKSGSTDYYSVEEYYYLSSYGQLDLDITVLDEWFTPARPSSYYKNQTTVYSGEEQNIGDQMIMDEALQYLEGKMDLSKFDSDGNGFIDAVIMVNTLTVNDNSNFSWAYRFWNIYTDEDGSLYSYDNVEANDYMWVPYGFIYESTDRFGRPTYTNTSVINTKVFIHEFGHILGAEDYYDTSYEDSDGPLYGHDIMDSEVGDHNPFTKFHYGWITKSRLVTATDSLTLTLEDFSKSGDTIIIADNWDDTLGLYQEYYILMYYRNTGLNSGKAGYFGNDGVVIYHVDASLYYELYEDEICYQLNNDNDSDGSEDNLIELVGATVSFIGTKRFVYTAGMTVSFCDYSLTVRSLDSTKATITFTK